jgi:ubiquitin C-terminal hydrolase
MESMQVEQASNKRSNPVAELNLKSGRNPSDSNLVVRIDARTISLAAQKIKESIICEHINAFALKALPSINRMSLFNKINQNVTAITIHGKSGLHNTGNTCYLNSALQFISHNFPLVYHLLSKKQEICQVLLNNGARILKTCRPFALPLEGMPDTLSVIPLSLKVKIHSGEYNPADLTNEERNLILSYTVTYRLIELLQYIWASNCVINPISFARIFINYNNPYFGDGCQHDAQEAYSQILTKIQDELKSKRDVNFCNISDEFRRFLAIKNEIAQQMQNVDASDLQTKQRIYDDFVKIKLAMPAEALMLSAFKEMKTYYSENSSIITDLHTSFVRNKITCQKCGADKNVFESLLHIILPIPPKIAGVPLVQQQLSLYDCLNLFTESENLGEENLRYCPDCQEKTQVTKKMSLWSTPQILIFQLSRFSPDRKSKDNRVVDIPIGDELDNKLDLTPYMSQYSTSTGLYKLQNAVLHSGTIGFGHYTEISLDPKSEQWLVYNDSKSDIASNYKMLIDRSAYLLMYVRDDSVD